MVPLAQAHSFSSLSGPISTAGLRLFRRVQAPTLTRGCVTAHRRAPAHPYTRTVSLLGCLLLLREGRVYLSPLRVRKDSPLDVLDLS